MRKLNFPYRNTLSQLISITRIGQIQEHKKLLINVLRAWTLMALSKKSQRMGITAVCIVAKADESSRFCVEYRTTLKRFLVRETWPMLNIEFHTDTVGGAKFITVCDVQSAY